MTRTARRFAVTLATLTLAAGTAAAQPDTAAATPRRSRDVSLGLSIGGTVASVATIVVGGLTSRTAAGPWLIEVGAASTLLAPSAGEWYAGQPFTVGMGMRAGGLAAAVVGVLAIAHADGPVCWGDPDGGGGCPATMPHPIEGDIGAGLVLVGGLAFVGGVVYDIVDAPRAADRFNNKYNVQLAPTILPTPTGTVAGLGVTGTF